MNPNLQSVQIALDNVSKIAERRQGLEAEQQELQTKIQTLTATVAGGDAKSVNPLNIAKASGKEFRRVEAIVRAFLETQITDGYLIEKFTLEITNNAKTVLAFGFLNARFSSLHINKLVDAKSVISRAKDAIALLEHVE